MITCFLQGGLGNQLFQIFTTIAYAIKNKQTFKFLYTTHLGPRPTYWNNFLFPLKMFTGNMPSISQFVPLKENGFHYTDLPLIKKENINVALSGYFQSYKYFNHIYKYLCELICLTISKQNIKLKYPYEYNDLISLHFRIGDYVNYPNHHPILPLEYYKKCIEFIIDKTKNDKLQILYFCESADNGAVNKHIENLQMHFPNCSFIRSHETSSDWEQLLMMSCCRHHIIANSSFSWWGAYFNQLEDKIVCYPEKWFGTALAQHNTNDLFPDNWNKIKF
jgi:hypothetical protein